MWKHLQPFGHRRSNSKRGNNRERNPRIRANTIGTSDHQIAPPPAHQLSKARSPSESSPPTNDIIIPPAPNTLPPAPKRQMTSGSLGAPQPQLPPTKVSLKTWWNHFAFAQRAKKDAEEKKAQEGENRVFGKPLKDSLKYANVQISTANANGELYVWGCIPVVVAKCGLYLKETATEVPGTFRVSGSNKRMRDLQAAFEAPPRFGKNLDWKQEHYTTHDVASVFRRFLTMMPEPVIPHDMYHAFRDALAKKPYNQDEAIARFKRLIRAMPRVNQYLLLYVLDLLSVFARKSDKNLMTAKNLAVIFRPALLSHPTHELSPAEHQLSQDVLEFLIEHQDWFMLDLPPPPVQQDPKLGNGLLTKEPVDMFISSNADQSGWKVVAKDEATNGSRRIARRRTTTEKSGESAGRMRLEVIDDLSPVVEDPPSRGDRDGAVTVTRSRTMPSRSTRGRPAAPGTTDDRKVLKKQKRASAQLAPRPGAAG